MKKQRSRRGIAIELAIGAMFAVAAMSILLLSSAMIKKNAYASDLERFQERQEEFIALDLAYKYGFDAPWDGEITYEATSDNVYHIKNGEKTILTVTTDESGNIVSYKQ